LQTPRARLPTNSCCARSKSGASRRAWSWWSQRRPREGLKAAVFRHFQGASWQRCLLSTTQGTSSGWWAPKGARTWRRSSAGDLRPGEQGDGPARLASEVADRWRENHPQVAEHIEEHIEECLCWLAFPESQRRRIRTTNGQERLNQQIKRRTRVVRIFPNRQSCLRLVSALAVEQSEEWVTGRR
jgi:putative transposase